MSATLRTNVSFTLRNLSATRREATFRQRFQTLAFPQSSKETLRGKRNEEKLCVRTFVKNSGVEAAMKISCVGAVPVRAETRISFECCVASPRAQLQRSRISLLDEQAKPAPSPKKKCVFLAQAQARPWGFSSYWPRCWACGKEYSTLSRAAG